MEDYQRKRFKEGSTWNNVFYSSFAPVQRIAKDSIHWNQKYCVFCNSGEYDGLNHVVSTSSRKDEINAVYLAPGCRKCNKSYDALTLQTDCTFLIDDRADYVRKSFYVMK